MDVQGIHAEGVEECIQDGQPAEVPESTDKKDKGTDYHEETDTDEEDVGQPSTAPRTRPPIPPKPKISALPVAKFYKTMPTSKPFSSIPVAAVKPVGTARPSIAPNAQSCPSCFQAIPATASDESLSYTSAMVDIMEREVMQLSTKVNQVFNIVCHTNTNVRKGDVEKIVDEEGLIQFNDKLGSDSLFALSVAAKLMFTVSREIYLGSKLMLALDLLFDRNFLTTCSWTGRTASGRIKTEFGKFSNMLFLIKSLAMNDYTEVTDDIIEQFFMDKLEDETSACEPKKPKLVD